VNIFVRQDGATWCIAVFNYASNAVNETVDLNRAGLPPDSYIVTNLWDGTTSTVTGSWSVMLNAKQSKLFRLSVPVPAVSRVSMSGGNFVFSGTNGASNAGYYVLASTNATTQFSNWTILETNNFDANGNFNVTNTINPGNPQSFYRIKVR
jgi:hypothetical protein